MKVALCQLAVTANKATNVANALAQVRQAASGGAELVVLPECFNAPYGPKYFPEYAERIPEGETYAAMSTVAKECRVYLVAGSIAEESEGKLYNTSTTFNPEGEMIAKYRKIHLFRINTPELTFDEGETLTAGDAFSTFELPHGVKTGLGICFDVRYPQMAAHYTDQGTSLMVFPGAFNMVTGPQHWSLMARARAIDSQQFVIFCSPARDEDADYVAYGHSLVADPWGNILAEAGHAQEIVYADIDTTVVEKTRASLPILKGTRHDVYKTVVA